MATLLLIEDDVELREELKDFLCDLGHALVEAATFEEGRFCLASHKIDIAIIDRRLPDGDGLALAREDIAPSPRPGIIFLTARDLAVDRIEGYEVGADHYLTKPVNLDELAVIIKSLGRRLQLEAQWRLNMALGTLKAPNGRLIALTGLEAAFLDMLARHPHSPLDRRELITGLGKDYRNYDPRNLDALLRRLRKKVHTGSGQDLPIHTRHGLGYQLIEPLTRAKN